MPKATLKKAGRLSPIKPPFDLQVFLDTAGAKRQLLEFRRAEKIYCQGDPAKSVKYIQEGGVRLSVINENGKEAVVAVLGPRGFALGLECANQDSRPAPGIRQLLLNWISGESR